MNNCNQVKDTCGTSLLASCVRYESNTNATSTLKEDCALSIEETTEDIYKQLNEIDLTTLGDKCLTYVTGIDNKTIVKNVLFKYEEEICQLKTKVGELQNTMFLNSSIVGGGLQVGALVDNCGNPPQTLKDILNIILDNLNNA